MATVDSAMPAIKEETPSSAVGGSKPRPRVGAAGSTSALSSGDVDVKTMSSKQYMDELVVPTMLRALSAVNKERPDDPIEFLIAYLSKERERSESPTNMDVTPAAPAATVVTPKMSPSKDDKAA